MLNTSSQLAKALMAAPKCCCYREMLKISAMLHGTFASKPGPTFLTSAAVQSRQEIFRRPPDLEEEAEMAHKLLATSPTSDHLTLLNIYDTYARIKGGCRIQCAPPRPWVREPSLTRFSSQTGTAAAGRTRCSSRRRRWRKRC